MKRILVLLFLGLLAVAAFAQDNAVPKASVPGGVYQHWLDEDVIYIIAPEERAAFLCLATNDERDQFIVQFWLHRDATPDTPKNEFKEEHYRRIAYSNENLADSLPGWKTDRGRVYIIEGPPETIRSVVPQSRVNAKDHREQIWVYPSGKRFRFVDACDCGEFRLLPPSSID